MITEFEEIKLFFEEMASGPTTDVAVGAESIENSSSVGGDYTPNQSTKKPSKTNSEQS
jgi:hypothetical protein